MREIKDFAVKFLLDEEVQKINKQLENITNRMTELENKFNFIEKLKEDNLRCKTCREGFYSFKGEEKVTDIDRCGEPHIWIKRIYECSKCHAKPPSNWIAE